LIPALRVNSGTSGWLGAKNFRRIGKKLGKHSQKEAALTGMSNLRFGAQVVGAIALAYLMPFLVFRLVSLFPGIGPDAQQYIGIALLIGSDVAVLWGYLRYQRLI
jgi:hypothetical protein